MNAAGILELVTFLEEQFRITLADEEPLPETMDSVDRLVRFMERRLVLSIGGISHREAMK